jgi:hypothetical protein
MPVCPDLSSVRHRIVLQSYTTEVSGEVGKKMKKTDHCCNSYQAPRHDSRPPSSGTRAERMATTATKSRQEQCTNLRKQPKANHGSKNKTAADPETRTSNQATTGDNTTPAPTPSLTRVMSVRDRTPFPKFLFAIELFSNLPSSQQLDLKGFRQPR